MKNYTMSFRESLTHKPDHPDRTAYRNNSGMNFDITFRVFPNRASMLKCIELQRQREHHPTDWKDCSTRKSA